LPSAGWVSGPFSTNDPNARAHLLEIAKGAHVYFYDAQYPIDAQTPMRGIDSAEGDFPATRTQRDPIPRLVAELAHEATCCQR
jgi:hypothetical protein